MLFCVHFAHYRRQQIANRLIRLIGARRKHL